MSRPPSFLAALTLLALAALLAASPAAARWYGSTMSGSPNATYGCESAAILGPLGGVELAPTNQRSCTYRHSGYLGSPRPASVVPGNGRITRIQVKSGPDPARLRLTVLTGSSRVDMISGQDIPGT